MGTKEYIKYIIEDLIPSGNFELSPGRHDVDSLVYYNVDEYNTKKYVDCQFEAHRRYIDIQYMVEGEELVYVTEVDSLQELIPYSEEKDVAFYSGGDNVNPQHLTAGNYLIFYPNDAHKPCVSVGKNGVPVKKVVFKVKIDE